MHDFNGLTTELKNTYFPEVVYYRDNKKHTKIQYTCELFNNGCLTLSKATKVISKLTKETEEKITQIILKYYTL
jgi:hypothetical protein